MHEGRKLLIPVAKHFACVAALLLFLPLLDAHERLPSYGAWNEVERYMNFYGKTGAQVVFCPDYLMNFARESHGGRFNKFFPVDVPDAATSIHDHYWILGSCKAVGATKMQRFGSGVAAYQFPFAEWSPTNTFFTDHYRRGQVSVQGREGDRSCPLRGDGFVCGGAPWERVAPVAWNINAQKRACIFIHPYPDGDLVLEYRDLDRGRVMVGLEDYAANDQRSNGVVQVHVNDDVISIDNDHRYGEVPFEGGELVVRVQTEQPRRRHVCFNVLP